MSHTGPAPSSTRQVHYQQHQSSRLWFFDATVTKWKRLLLKILGFFLLCFTCSWKFRRFRFSHLLCNYIFISEICPHIRWHWSVDSTDRSLLHTDTERPVCTRQRPSEISCIVIPVYTQDHCTCIGIKKFMSVLAPVFLQWLLAIYTYQNYCVILEHKIISGL